MPRQQARKQVLNFVGGLNTESSPLSYPENASKDMDNTVLNRDGSVQRRKGVDFETNSQYSEAIFSSSDLETAAISAHEWESVDGDDTLNFFVVQVGGVLYFHDLGAQTFSTSIIGYIDLEPIKTREDYEQYVISATYGKGKLFVVSPAISPAYIQYDPDTGTFSGVKITLKIRDTDGIEENQDAPVVFGDDVTPGDQTDPSDDTNDTLNPVIDPDDFFPFIPIIPGFTF